jgi:hypothetical protein
MAMELAIGAPALSKYIKICYLKISNMYYFCIYILSWYLPVQFFFRKICLVAYTKMIISKCHCN